MPIPATRPSGRQGPRRAPPSSPLHRVRVIALGQFVLKILEFRQQFRRFAVASRSSETVADRRAAAAASEMSLAGPTCPADLRQAPRPVGDVDPRCGVGYGHHPSTQCRRRRRRCPGHGRCQHRIRRSSVPSTTAPLLTASNDRHLRSPTIRHHPTRAGLGNDHHLGIDFWLTSSPPRQPPTGGHRPQARSRRRLARHHQGQAVR